VNRTASARIPPLGQYAYSMQANNINNCSPSVVIFQIRFSQFFFRRTLTRERSTRETYNYTLRQSTASNRCWLPAGPSNACRPKFRNYSVLRVTYCSCLYNDIMRTDVLAICLTPSCRKPCHLRLLPSAATTKTEREALCLRTIRYYYITIIFAYN
jgi:hypothetical protein